MKSKVLFSVAVFPFLFIQQLAAQDLSRVLQDKEDRHTLYYSIINNDERFYEFMESAKISGRANEGIRALNEGNKEASQAEIALTAEATENQLVMDQMLDLMEELVAKDPDFQRIIEAKYPEIGEMMKKGK